jgi:hypothetical protein
MPTPPVTGSAVSAAGATLPMTTTSPPPTPAMNGTLAPIAGMLGLSTPGVQGALTQGASITDLAARQGVSRTALVQATQGLIQQSREAAGQPPADQSTLDRMVNRAFDRSRRVSG